MSGRKPWAPADTFKGVAWQTEDNFNATQRKLRILVSALERADRLCREALPRFNWGASALDANAITLLNEVPNEIRAALKEVRS